MMTLTLIGLFVFGVAYDALVAALESRGYHEGYVALLVVGGCAVTVAASAFMIGNEAALKVFGCFAASGAPMVFGSMRRHARKRRLDKERAKERLLHWRKREDELEQRDLEGLDRQ